MPKTESRNRNENSPLIITSYQHPYHSVNWKTSVTLQPAIPSRRPSGVALREGGDGLWRLGTSMMTPSGIRFKSQAFIWQARKLTSLTSQHITSHYNNDYYSSGAIIIIQFLLYTLLDYAATSHITLHYIIMQIV
jgi:hypothetical protein